MKRIGVLVAAATLLTLLAAGPASAAPTFHGGWTDSVFSAGCLMPPHPVEGNWNVTLLPDGRAAVHYTTFEWGEHWASVGGAKMGDLWDQLTLGSGDEFRVSTDSWGTTFTMTLHDDVLTFLIAPYGPCTWGQATGYLIH